MSMNFGKGNRAIAFNPTSAFPLDARTYFESYDDALAKAQTAEEVGSTNTQYHYGMKLLVNEDGVYTWYVITANNTLEPESNGGDEPSTDYTTVWYINDEPSLSMLPYDYIYVSFTSNGKQYERIGKNAIGSSSWGIYSLAYGLGGTSDNVYTYNPSGSYGISHGWRNEAYRTITIHEPINNVTLYAWLIANATLISGEVSIPCQPSIDVNLKTQNKTIVGAINEVNEKVNNSSGGSFEMPIIRFTGVRSANGTPYLTEDNIFYFCVEVIGGGAVQQNDSLELCAMRTCKRAAREHNGGAKRQRLRKLFSHYVATFDQPKWLALAVGGDSKHVGQLFSNDRKDTTKYGCRSNLYLRIRRPIYQEGTSKEIDAKFSNTIMLDKSYSVLTRKLTFK